jgi:hypothetical protein
MSNFFIAGKDLFIDLIFIIFVSRNYNPPSPPAGGEGGQSGVWSRERGIGSPEYSGFGTWRSGLKLSGCGPAKAGLVVPSPRDSGRRGRY